MALIKQIINKIFSLISRINNNWLVKIKGLLLYPKSNRLKIVLHLDYVFFPSISTTEHYEVCLFCVLFCVAVSSCHQTGVKCVTPPSFLSSIKQPKNRIFIEVDISGKTWCWCPILVVRERSSGAGKMLCWCFPEPGGVTIPDSDWSAHTQYWPLIGWDGPLWSVGDDGCQQVILGTHNNNTTNP